MKKRYKVLIFFVGTLAAVSAAFLIYTGVYYHAEDIALAAMGTEDGVAVSQTGYGWFLDGPSEENLFVFYPGAKVEETAYMPLLRQLAGQGMDVCLVKMPFRLAFFGADKATEVFPLYQHENRYVGGHSLGGAMAASYAAKHTKTLRGVILFAAYPTKTLNDPLMLLSIYGSEDGVLDMEKVANGRQYAPQRYTERVIAGGNHAQFGNYGVQKGDGGASVSAEEQQKQTVELILQTTR